MLSGFESVYRIFFPEDPKILMQERVSSFQQGEQVSQKLL